jgi:hypothetical protein
MLLAAGLGSPALAHIVDGLARQGYTELVANLHHRPDAIRAGSRVPAGSALVEAVGRL